MLRLFIPILFTNLLVIFAQNTSQFNPYIYLQTYGYLPLSIDQHTFNETLKLAIREFQRVASVPSSGQFDNQTLQLFGRQRCALSDTEIVRLNRSDHLRLATDTIKGRTLSYKVTNAARTLNEIEHIRRIAYDAATMWNSVANLELFETQDQEADVEIEFKAIEQRNELVLNDEDTILGNTSLGENKTQVQFNDNISWTYFSFENEVNLKQAMLHQLGHALGLQHSDHPKSVMYPYYDSSNVQLHQYDISLIQRLYGSKHNNIEFTTTTIKQESAQFSTKSPSNLPIDLCNSAVDAIEIIGDSIFMFRHDKYWQVDLNGTLLARPRLIREYWPELLTWPINAVLELNGQLLFFVGSQVLTFQNRRLKSSQPLVEMGIDSTSVRLAYKWIYGEAMYFVWNETHYWKLNTHTIKPEVDYPRKIDNVWTGVPLSVSAAFTWGKDLFFVDAGEFLKFDSFKMNISRGYPRRFSQVFDYCAPKIEV